MAATLERSIYLASRSPRRRELLELIGVRYELLLGRAQPCADAAADETVRAGETPRAYVQRVARAKAEAGWQHLLERGLPRAPVLGADTTVALGARIFGKAASAAEAAAMLAALAGREHEVMTAVALRDEARLAEALSVSTVRLRALCAAEIEAYLGCGEWQDKAGAYAIQGQAARFVAHIQGSHSGIVGLPLYETAQLLEQAAVARERRAAP